MALIISKRLAVATALSLCLHCVSLLFVFFWTDNHSRSAEIAALSVLSIRLISSDPGVNSDAASPDSLKQPSPDSSDTNLKSILSTTSVPVPSAQIDIASLEPTARSSTEAALLNPISAVGSAIQGQKAIPAPFPVFEEPLPIPAFKPAKPSSIPKPNYPLRARRQGLEGIVLIELDIDAAGFLSGFEFTPPRGDSLLEESVLASLKNLSFIPAEEHGMPVSSTLLLKFRFELED